MSEATDAHEQRIQAYALGRLSAQETADLEALAASDTALRAELALARAMARARTKDPVRSASSAFGWARLSRAIDAQPLARPGLIRLPDRFSRWQTAAAVFLAVAVWQFAAVPSLQEHGRGAGPGYGMAGGPQTPTFIARVTFRPEATELQIRQALLQVGAHLVAGPSALGLYDLAFANQAALTAGLTLLRANKALVEQVQAAPQADKTVSASRPG